MLKSATLPPPPPPTAKKSSKKDKDESASGSSGDTTPPANDKVFPYVIQKGDSLSVIVQAYREKNIKVTVDRILKANPGLDEKKLKVGQKIYIPNAISRARLYKGLNLSPVTTQSLAHV